MVKGKLNENAAANMDNKHYFYTDQTGNNHHIIRQIMKKRPWMQRMDNIDKKAQFKQVRFFWTQWHKKSVTQYMDETQIYGKIEHNYKLTNKTNLYKTLSVFY